MGQHDTLLGDNALWREYVRREPDSARRDWVREVFCTAMDWLKAVPVTFPNYTLHDETHVLNVMSAMASVLGARIGDLSIGEVELLILAASLHDVGMVYNDASKKLAAEDERKCRDFLLKNQPDLVGCPWDEWSSDELQQRYLRSLHPFRVLEVLDSDVWRPLFERRPKDIVSEDVIVAVCEAHGEDERQMKKDPSLHYQPAQGVDPLFCAMLLRLCDLLDFDDTRAPSVLFRFASVSGKSVEEWKKHMASGGFVYRDMPSDGELTYSAECKEPGVYHTVLEFLGWIDDELAICDALRRFCRADLQNFPFPRRVSRESVKCIGFSSEEFKLTMDQEQILHLLTGENLYSGNDAFVRELLQNAIDATLLREQLEQDFHAEKARIDLREWCDSDGTLWFRIDDQGTGMTAGMLKRYFLKVGNSYYTSKELTQDLRRHAAAADYRGISRFGVGFLSCFLCGVSAEVSTLYCDDWKSREDCAAGAGDRRGYGLRMEITGLTGYYALRSQAEGHSARGDLPAPEAADGCAVPKLEYNGYRSKAGTSIVVKLDPGKLGTVNLKEAAESWLCGARVPVYYNGERIGRTYDEIMSEAHDLAGETVYELSEEDKAEFDKAFPMVAGNYPKIVAEVIPLDRGEYQMHSGLSGVIVKYGARFDDVPEWKSRDQQYYIVIDDVSAFSHQTLGLSVKKEQGTFDCDAWHFLQLTYKKDDVDALEACFSTLSACPSSAEELGDVWRPFARSESVRRLWRSYVDSCQGCSEEIRLQIPRAALLSELAGNERRYGAVCSFQGVYCGDLGGGISDGAALFFLNHELQPDVNLARTRIVGLPIQALASICGVVSHPSVDCGLELASQFVSNRFTLAEWRSFRESDAGQRVWQSQNARISHIRDTLQKPSRVIWDSASEESVNNIGSKPPLVTSPAVKVLYHYITAAFQDEYDMTIDYANRQAIGFSEKRTRESHYDLFPPMLFCKAANDPSRRYLCCDRPYYRRGITANHPFAAWLVQNAPRLNAHFARQFAQIVSDLCEENPNDIIATVNTFRAQLTQLTDRHGIDPTAIPPLTEDDFYHIEI